jgi:hypothetical protein
MGNALHVAKKYHVEWVPVGLGNREDAFREFLESIDIDFSTRGYDECDIEITASEKNLNILKGYIDKLRFHPYARHPTLSFLDREVMNEEVADVLEEILNTYDKDVHDGAIHLYWR